MSRSNCIIWAVRMHVRRRGRPRRYIKWRWSDWGWFPHCLYEEARPNGRRLVVSYKPTNPKPQLIPPPFFVGHVCYGDALPQKDTKQAKLARPEGP